MSRPKKPSPWAFLSNDTDGVVAIVVPEGTPDVLAVALCEAIVSYHGGPAQPDHPLIREVASSLSVQTWRSCTVNYWEREEGYESWWAHDGDGRSTITVVELSDIDLYALGDHLSDKETT